MAGLARLFKQAALAEAVLEDQTELEETAGPTPLEIWVAVEAVERTGEEMVLTQPSP
jgi:hypothetical protein